MKYHGSEEGWNELLATDRNHHVAAGRFHGQAVCSSHSRRAGRGSGEDQSSDKEMSFAEWELVLSAGKPEDADKVWSVIKGVAMQMEGQVIKAAPTELQIAGSQDDIDEKRADIMLTMGGTIPAKLMPKEESTLDFEGTPVSYTPDPFVMTMEKGALLTKAAPAAPKKPAPHRHRASRIGRFNSKCGRAARTRCPFCCDSQGVIVSGWLSLS